MREALSSSKPSAACSAAALQDHWYVRGCLTAATPHVALVCELAHVFVHAVVRYNQRVHHMVLDTVLRMPRRSSGAVPVK